VRRPCPEAKAAIMRSRLNDRIEDELDRHMHETIPQIQNHDCSSLGRIMGLWNLKSMHAARSVFSGLYIFRESSQEAIDATALRFDSRYRETVRPGGFSLRGHSFPRRLKDSPVCNEPSQVADRLMGTAADLVEQHSLKLANRCHSVSWKGGNQISSQSYRVGGRALPMCTIGVCGASAAGQAVTTSD